METLRQWVVPVAYSIVTLVAILHLFPVLAEPELSPFKAIHMGDPWNWKWAVFFVALAIVVCDLLADVRWWLTVALPHFVHWVDQRVSGYPKVECRCADCVVRVSQTTTGERTRAEREKDDWMRQR